MNRHYIFYGRMNPLSRGHEAIINQMALDAERDGASSCIVTTHSQDPRYNNPLDLKRKLYYLDQTFPNINVAWTDACNPSLLHILTWASVFCNNRKESLLRIYCGSDRANEYRELIYEYNGVDSKHGRYYFDNIEIWPVGDDRSPGNTGEELTGMYGIRNVSSTAMRESAKLHDKKAFLKYCPKNMPEKVKEELYLEIHDAYLIPF